MTNVHPPLVAESRASRAAPRVAIAAAITVLLLLAGLHVLSPEFDPSWRMVSEYANGNYRAVLSLMFASWALSSWALAYAIWPHACARAGRVGVVFLVTAGVGEAMASVFDIKHPLHGLSALIGIPSLSIAAMLISVSLGRSVGWRFARRSLLWSANLTWISIVLMAVAFATLITTFKAAGGDMNAGTAITTLPEGVIAVVGWANRFLVVAYCAWISIAGWHTIALRRERG